MFDDKFWVFKKDWELLGCSKPGDTFNAYVIDPESKKFDPDPKPYNQKDDAALVPGILHKCIKIDAGSDRNTKSQNLAVSEMVWPNQGKDDGSPQQSKSVVGVIIGSTAECKALTCPEDEYVNEDAGYAGECQACLPTRDGKIVSRCRSTEFMSGKCQGNSNTLKCEPCNAPGSDDEYCPKDAWLQYRVGACGGGTTNKFECLDQPNCTEGTNLKSYAEEREGRCETCRRATCRSGQYRKGSCAGIVSEYTCDDCDAPKCSDEEGKEEFLDGECGGTSNTFECKTCSNVVCGEHEYRAGESCNEVGEGFVCKVQPICKPGEFYQPTDPSGSVAGLAKCLECPDGTFQPNPGREPNCIPHAEPCDSSDGQTYEKVKPTKTTEAVCATSALCAASQYESKPLLSNGERECSPLTACTAGQYVAKPSSSTKDQVCKDCTFNQDFTIGLNERSCTQFRMCGVNEKVATRGTVTSDLICGPCEAGTYVDREEHQQAFCRETTTTTSATTTTTITTTTSTGTATSTTTTENVPGATVLREPASAGDTVLEIDSNLGFKVGDIITVSTESNVIAGFRQSSERERRSKVNAIILTTPLLDSYGSGTTVVLVVTVDVADSDAGSLASLSSSSDIDGDAAAGGGSGSTGIIVGGAAAGILVSILVAVVLVLKSNGTLGGADSVPQHVIAFENPMYTNEIGVFNHNEENEENDAMFEDYEAGDDDQGLYDEPTAVSGIGGEGYLEVGAHAGGDDADEEGDEEDDVAGFDDDEDDDIDEVSD